MGAGGRLLSRGEFANLRWCPKDGADQLKMKPSANVSQQVRRFVTTPEDKLPEPVKGGARIDD